MEEFTKNMLERAKLRRQKIDSHRSQIRNHRPLEENHSSNIDLRGQGDHTAFYQQDNQSTNSVLENILSISAKSKLQQLGDLYSDNSEALSSPIHKAEQKLLTDANKTPRQTKCRLGRLNELASTINQWEDDLSHIDLKKRPEETKPKTSQTKRLAPEPPVTPMTPTAKITRTETKLSESTVTTVIHMATINKTDDGAEHVNKTTATIKGVAGSGKLRQAGHQNETTTSMTCSADKENRTTVADLTGQTEEVTAEEELTAAAGGKVPRVTAVICNSGVADKSGHPNARQAQWDQAIKQTLMESQGLRSTDTPKQTYCFGDSVSSGQSSPKVSHSPSKSPVNTGTYRKSSASPGKVVQKGSLKKAAPLPPTGCSKNVQSAQLPPSGYKKHQSPVTPGKVIGFKKSSPSPRKSPKMGVSALDKDSSVLKKAALFEKHLSPVKSKDPAELSLAERKALFEKNKGEVLLPKVAFATPLPAKMQKSPARQVKTVAKVVKHSPVSKPGKENTVTNMRDMFERDLVEATNVNLGKLEREKDLEFLKNRWNKNKGCIEESSGPAPPPPPMPMPSSPLATSPAPPLNKYPPSPQRKNSDRVISNSQKRSENPAKRSSKLMDNAKSPIKRSSKLMESPSSPVRRSSKLMESPKARLSSPIMVTPPTKNSTPEPYKDSPETLKTVQNVRKIVVSPPKEGKLYPNLSDIEMSEESNSSSSSPMNDSNNSNIYLNMSFGDILEASKLLPATPPCTQESAVLNEMDLLLDEALGEVSSNEENEGPTPPKQIRGLVSSDSFEYERGTPAKKASTPLLRTVSLYRKEQSSMSQSTPVSSSQLLRQMMDVSDEVRSDADEEEAAAAVQRKMEQLALEMRKQAAIIAQASNAINHCMARIEFTESEEQVEGERCLLHAENVRKACDLEYQRLKVEGTLRPKGCNTQQLTEKGRLTISNITVPLKREAIRNMAAEESMLYFVCLLRSDEKVQVSQVARAMAPNMAGNALTIPGQLQLDNLYGDFKATVEIYHMSLTREMLPAHIKYHLPGKKDKRLLTPMKNKKHPARTAGHIQSPAAMSIRNTNFQLSGYMVFSLREAKRTQWTLNRASPHSKPSDSPLEGTMGMNITCSLKVDAEHRGFLNMFDDVSGLGAWHRRWCLLSAHHLTFWKYPEDENTQVPLGSIDLRSVITQKVGQVSREICARNNTFLLETTRPRMRQDSESLVLLLDGETARIRHLLCADDKQEAIEWCAHLNKALALIRAWNCQS